MNILDISFNSTSSFEALSSGLDSETNESIKPAEM